MLTTTMRELLLFPLILLLALTANAANSGEALSGDYRDPSSNERLSLRGTWSAPEVLYRGSRGGPPRKLEVVDVDAGEKTFSVRFPNARAQYHLKLGDHRESLSCRGPDGKTQDFRLETGTGDGGGAAGGNPDVLARYFALRKQTYEKVNAGEPDDSAIATDEKAHRELTRLLQSYLGPISFKTLTPVGVDSTPESLINQYPSDADCWGGLVFEFKSSNGLGAIRVTDSAIINWPNGSRRFDFDKSVRTLWYPCHEGATYEEVVRITGVSQGALDHVYVTAIGGSQGDPLLKPSQLVVVAQKGSRIYVAGFNVGDEMPEAKACIAKFRNLEHPSYSSCYQAELRRTGVLEEFRRRAEQTLAELQ
jgi:hypothetical protein